MNRDDAFYRHFDHVHSIAVKVVRQLPDDRLDFRATPEMYTARELAFHMFSQERAMLAGCRRGELVLGDFRAPHADLPAMKTADDLARYGEQVHAETNQWVATCSDDDYQRPVKTFFGHDMPPLHMLSGAYDHVIHHRGQLYVYLRLLGIKPVNVFTGESD
jgi:uncharacterized damage-inducible protein DinB